jgi:hypothetical protein
VFLLPTQSVGTLTYLTQIVFCLGTLVRLLLETFNFWFCFISYMITIIYYFYYFIIINSRSISYCSSSSSSSVYFCDSCGCSFLNVYFVLCL